MIYLGVISRIIFNFYFFFFQLNGYFNLIFALLPFNSSTIMRDFETLANFF